jgi:predicted 3-demethylubiquinone-9 3-methyltransferase (glyoxalase superfamily)
MQTVGTCLWFDTQAEDAAKFYVGIFPNSRIVRTSHYLDGMPKPAGSVLTVDFVLDGTEFLALNAGPQFPHSPAMSLVANCRTQQEVDRLWAALGEGGQPSQCGWLTDRFGVSWQVVPQPMVALLNSPDRAASQRTFAALMTMTKLDMAALQRAYDGR